jgi:hypothetical protein
VLRLQCAPLGDLLAERVVVEVAHAPGLEPRALGGLVQERQEVAMALVGLDPAPQRLDRLVAAFDQLREVGARVDEDAGDAVRGVVDAGDVDDPADLGGRKLRGRAADVRKTAKHGPS